MLSVDSSLLKGYTFIDLFAGIGGFHYALNSFGAKCVFASEWDVYAAETYERNFGIKPFGDITKIKEEDIPSHDILCGGFPCQAFSISGKQKGFDDTRGTLFFDIARIIDFHHPKIVFLENVKNLLKHDDGKTMRVVVQTLEALGYDVFYQILNTSNYGLPQNRERIYIVGFRKDLNISSFSFPAPMKQSVALLSVLESAPNAKVINRNDIEITKQYNAGLDLFTNDIKYPNRPIQIGKVGKGGQGERIYDPIGHAITLSAYGGGVGAKTGLYLVDGVVRKLSTRECARCQGFPEEFVINRSEQQAYKQFGNSVSINVLQLIVKQMIKCV